jgi:hypothetical protein
MRREVSEMIRGAVAVIAIGAIAVPPAVRTDLGLECPGS